MKSYHIDILCVDPCPRLDIPTCPAKSQDFYTVTTCNDYPVVSISISSLYYGPTG
jgi:hypothetical protein